MVAEVMAPPKPPARCFVLRCGGLLLHHCTPSFAMREATTAALTLALVSLLVALPTASAAVDSQLVLGIDWDRNDPRAYPLETLNFHEIVNDIDSSNRSFAVTWAPLTGSNVIFRTEDLYSYVFPHRFCSILGRHPMPNVPGHVQRTKNTFLVFSIFRCLWSCWTFSFQVPILWKPTSVVLSMCLWSCICFSGVGFLLTSSFLRFSDVTNN